MDLQLQDLRALVTGASRGLGFATARRLAEEGTLVAINSRDVERLTSAAQEIQAETRAEVAFFPGDVTRPDFPDQLVQSVVDRFGGLDILITNSGGPPPGAFESFSDADWYRAVDLVFMSHVRLIRAALPHLRRSRAASVLTTTSYSVKQPLPNLILSNSIRAATAALTKSLAIELGAEGIRFNSILPGWTQTDRINELMSARARSKGTSVEEEIGRQAQDIPLERMGTAAEFANAAAFLVSPAASYITGVLLNVDGGVVKGLF